MPLALLVSFLLKIVICAQNTFLSSKVMWELSVFCVGVSRVLMYTWGIFQGTQQPLFLRHEGYLGAIGAFLKGADEDGTFKSLFVHHHVFQKLIKIMRRI